MTPDSDPPAASLAGAGAQPPSSVPAPDAPAPAIADRSDQELALLARDGDRAALAEIVRRHQGAVFGYVRARVLQLSDAEDLTQEVFLRCYSSWQRYDASALLRPWLLGIARNLLRDHARRRKRRKEVAWTELCLELDDMVSSHADVYGDQLEFLPGCLGSLGESARQAIELRYAGQFRLSQIGEKLHRSEGAAKLLMFRARQALKNCLDRKVQGHSS